MSDSYSSTQFLNIIDNHQLSNVYFIYGEDHFLSDKIIKALVDKYTCRDDREFDLVNLFGEDINSEDIIEQLEMFPFLAEHKVVVVRGFDQLKEKDKTKLAEYIHKIPASSILIVHCEKIKKSTKIFKAFDKFLTISAKQPAGYWEIEKWLNAELRRLRIRSSMDTISLFSSKIEADYYTAYNELEKLLIFIGDKKVLTRQDVETCMENNRASSVFELQNAIGNRDKAKALYILHNYLEAEEGKNSVLMIIMLTRFFQTIWKVKYLQVQNFSISEIQANYLKEVHPTFRKDYIRFAQNYARIRMSKIFDLLLQADYKLKSTDLAVNVLFTKLVVSIIS
jgi:DNA polymerase-3 subunit delta